MYACAAGTQSEAEGKSKPVTNEVPIDGAVDHEYHEWVEPEPPSVGILKSSRPTTDDSKQQGKKGKRAGRKLVPVWRLVS